ncbi:MAG: TIGR03013 family PEP-CTERM/XrtA system glycosyltransferase, partial [Thauera phenolivorans]|nr:TIGR03013 family PEP-CTERM/XrtA system glycosyltransferase [Thauera phenolivorans]
ASSSDAFRRVALSVVISVPIALVIFNLLPWSAVTSAPTRYSTLAALGLLLLMRGLGGRWGAKAMTGSRVMIVGVGPDAEEVRRVLADDPARHGFLVGFYPGVKDDEYVVDPRKTLPQRDLLEAVRENKVTEVVVALRERRGGNVSLRALLDCRLAGVKVTDVSSFFERTSGQIRVDSLRASWLIYGDGFRQGVLRTVVKRCFDIVCSLVLLILASPVMLLTALLVLLEDGAPVFYRQTRVGLGGRTFEVIKFRSMRRDAEKDGKPRWASANDDRVTRIGRIIRRLRIDELPQLFNVLIGEMSLVGPRPERPYFVDQLVKDIPFYSVRHCVKPGVTGWAQVRYQYGSSVDDSIEKLQYDLYYVKNHTLVLDIAVLFETVRVVLTGEGAQ